MVNIFKKCRELVEADSDQTVQSALCAAAGLEVVDGDGKVKGKALKTLFAAAAAFGFGAVWSLTAEYTRSNTAGGARSAWKGVTAEVVVTWNYDSSVFPATKGVGLYMECPKKKGTRGKGKNGDAGKKDEKSEKDEKKGEEAEHSDGEDKDDDTLMLEGSEAGKEFA
ncbi:unnamed protein product [Closterium sp. Naga37s-1]|nr:unnamed protein product [Closterium sp. Naga37s-1]